MASNYLKLYRVGYMELHQLRDFVALAETGKFHEAAKRCHVAQSSLSKAIQRLEAEFGEKLFTRLRNRVLLTAAGRTLYKRANRIIGLLEDTKRELAEANGLRRGKVTVGVLPTIAPYFLPRVVSRFTEACPSLEVEIQEDITADIIHLLDACELDLALLSLPLPGDRLEKRLLFQEDLLLAVPSNHPLAVKEQVSLRDLENQRFILMKNGHSLGDQILSFCNRNDLHLQVVFRSSQIETIQSLVMAGLGVSLVPQMSRIGGRIPIVYRSLENPRPTRTVVAVWRKERPLSRAAAEFLKHSEQVAKASRETLPEQSISELLTLNGSGVIENDYYI